MNVNGHERKDGIQRLEQGGDIPKDYKYKW
jgi:hypothetical protein